MKNFTKLSRAEMKTVLGGLRRKDPQIECYQGLCLDGGGCPDGCSCTSIPFEGPEPDPSATTCTDWVAYN